MDFSGEPPRFCSYCGQLLAKAPVPPGQPVSLSEAPTQAPPPRIEETGDYDPDATLPPNAPGAGLVAEDPKNIGGYKILRRLGSGGMGVVYEAEDAVTGQRVALKLISSAFATNPEVVKRFRQEGKLASKITHPRCVFILAADEEKGRPYIVMELMPGQTLAEYVRTKGPLPVAEAVQKILDVIDGLSEVHRLGLVHRDMKPSNCFLDHSGRIKVADFGLAKSLVRQHLGETSAHLTKTGAFLGTPLYAAPEQVKGEQVDPQADVYAVAATAYFALTGKAPFEGAGDPMAILAQIVSDDPKPLSSLRSDIPAELDEVILRGLERDKRKRYRSLQEFREALLPFAPRQQDIVGLGLRLGAFLLDHFFLSLLTGVAGAALLALSPFGHDEINQFLRGDGTLLVEGITGLSFLFYFVVSEKWWGATPAKRILRLRVCQVQHAALPRLWQALVRGLVFYFFFSCTTNVFAFFYPPPHHPRGMAKEERDLQDALYGMLVLTVLFGGWGLLLLPMRRRNGYRGLHEWVSGTRTIRLPGASITEKASVIVRRDSLPVLQPEGSPHEIGPYIVHGCHRWEPGQQILLGEDSSLGRLVWIWRRPAAIPPLPQQRREVSREGRWRWLSTGTENGWHWDAFLATPGASLTTVIKRTGPATWKQARVWLHALTQELTEACADGTLPTELAPAQVWLQANGNIQLLDMNPETAALPQAQAAEDTEEERALVFLRQVATLLLEGEARLDLHRLQAPLPLHVLKLLNRLLGVEGPRLTLAEWHQELTAVLEKPAEVSRSWRLWHGIVHTILVILVATLVCSLFQEVMLEETGTRGSVTFALPLYFLCCMLWSACFRGGLTFGWMELALCRADGRRATRLQCAWRTFLVGAPAVLLILLREAAKPGAQASLTAEWTYSLLHGGLFAYLLVLALGMVLHPRRGWHDVLAGTYVVPR
jgi:uncharacterized RDD family membrane protein YckC